jgi:hypothetical protein
MTAINLKKLVEYGGKRVDDTRQQAKLIQKMSDCLIIPRFAIYSI